jgi:hypothetical protein
MCTLLGLRRKVVRIPGAFMVSQIEEDGDITASGTDLKELQKELYSKSAPGGGAKTSFSIVLPNASAVYQVLDYKLMGIPFMVWLRCS